MRPRIGAVAGMLGPLVFIATFTLEGWLRPGYHARRMFISALSLGPRGWIQIVNFIVLGTTLLLFARAVAAVFASRAGHVLLAITAVAFFASGPFVMDPMGTVPKDMTWHGIVHGIFGGLVFSLAPVTCFVFWRHFRADPRWRSLQAGTFVAGVVGTIGLVLMRIGMTPENVLASWIGLVQRITLGAFLVWIGAFALTLYRRC